MKDGVVQQCAPPLEVYHRPANRFVAGFLGTPPMNFLEGRLIDEGGRLLFDEGTAKLPIPARAASALRAAPGGTGAEVVLGIRPEAIAPLSQARFPTVDAGAPMQLPTKVWLAQPLGSKMDVYLSTARHPRLVAHIDAEKDRPSGFAVGDTIPIAVDMTRAHFFEKGETGRALA
jgi:multiple sugar transport system ATP-binding protein